MHTQNVRGDGGGGDAGRGGGGDQEVKDGGGVEGRGGAARWGLGEGGGVWVSVMLTGGFILVQNLRMWGLV